jgi:small subunit ribosomal protein S20
MRQNEKRRLRNQAYRSRVKTAIKNYMKALESESPESGKLLSQASSLIQRGVAKGIFHKNHASRTIGRLSKKLSAQAP